MPENLDLVRSILAAWEQGDFSRADWAHPEIEYVTVGGLNAATVTGRLGMAHSWGRWLSAWERLHVEAEEYRVLDPERVLVLLVTIGRGKASGLELEQTQAKGAVLFHVRGGEVTRLVQYWDREGVLAELGLDCPES
jgi:ketosteroid isomerase-like protein